VYGCAAGSRRAYRLGRTGACIGSRSVAAVAVTGRVAAYAVNSCGIDASSTEVKVQRLSDGKVLSTQPALSGTAGPESLQSVTSIIVNRSGRAAWIVTSHSIVAHQQTVEVVEQSGRHTRVLDNGAAIRTDSLRLQGSKLSWKQGGRTKTATFD
jgi:hypothetical protein